MVDQEHAAQKPRAYGFHAPQDLLMCLHGRVFGCQEPYRSVVALTPGGQR